MSTLHNKISRTIYTTFAECTYYNQDNKKVTETVKILGNYKNKKHLATRICKKLRIDQVLVHDFFTKKHYYSMTMDCFAKHADKKEIRK